MGRVSANWNNVGNKKSRFQFATSRVRGSWQRNNGHQNRVVSQQLLCQSSKGPGPLWDSVVRLDHLVLKLTNEIAYRCWDPSQSYEWVSLWINALTVQHWTFRNEFSVGNDLCVNRLTVQHWTHRIELRVDNDSCVNRVIVLATLDTENRIFCRQRLVCQSANSATLDTQHRVLSRQRLLRQSGNSTGNIGHWESSFLSATTCVSVNEDDNIAGQRKSNLQSKPRRYRVVLKNETLTSLRHRVSSNQPNGDHFLTLGDLCVRLKCMLIRSRALRTR